MTVKELKEKLNDFKDDDKVYFQEEYNSSGGVSEVSYVEYSKYEKNIVVIDK